MSNSSSTATSVTVQTTIHAPVEKVWQFFTQPEHITGWNFASDEWHSPRAENDLRTGGRFVSRMEAKDGSAGFDFGGVYDEVKEQEKIAYTMDDKRKVIVVFKSSGDTTEVTETFDAENTFPVEYQKSGWQSILDNFRKYVEEKVGNER